MAVSYGAVGTGAGATSTSTLTSGGIPTCSLGDMLVTLMGWGNDAGTALTAPSGWTFLGDQVGGTGTYGTDTGLRHLSVYWRIADDGDVAGTASYTWTNGGGTSGTRTIFGYMSSYTKTGYAWQAPVMSSGADNDLVSNYSAVTTADCGTAFGDINIIAAATIPVATNPTLLVTWPSSTSATAGILNGTSASGAKVRLNSRTNPPTANQASSGAPTISVASQISGPAVAVRLREKPARWTGNGNADGTSVTTTAIANTTGSGTMVTRQVAGTQHLTTAGDGVEIYGTTSDINRLDTGPTFAPSTRTFFQQGFVTWRQAGPTTATEPTLTSWTTGATTLAGGIYNPTAGTFIVVNSAGTTLATGPSLTVGDKYQLNMITVLNTGTPTTSNGRIIVRITNLTNSSWNTTGKYYYDSGATVNMSTGTGFTRGRFGKQASGAIASGTPTLYENWGWDETLGDLSGYTTQAAVEALMDAVLPSPYLSGSTYFTDFTTYTAGSIPSDWTRRWTTSGIDPVVTTNAGYGGAKNGLFYAPTADATHSLSWNSVDADLLRSDVEILFRWKNTSASAQAVSAMSRGSGAAASETGYTHGNVNTNTRVAKWVAGTATTITNLAGANAANTWYWTRVRTIGAQNQIRTWLDGTTEPSTWDITENDTSIVSGGWVGLYQFGSTGDTTWDFFSAATGGLTAPSPAAAFLGTAALSGSGTLTEAGIPTPISSAAFSGSGSLVDAGIPALLATVTLAGSGTLTGTQIAMTVLNAAAALAGAGTLTSAGTPKLISTWAQTGSGTLVPAGGAGFAAPVTLSGTGALTFAGSPKPIQTIGFTGSGTLVTAGKPAIPGTVALSGSGVLTFTPKPGFATTAALSGSGTLTISGLLVVTGTIALSGSGTLVTAGIPKPISAVTLSGSGTLTFSVLPKFISSAVLNGAGTLTIPARTPKFISAAALSGSGLLTGLGKPYVASTVGLTGSGQITYDGHPAFVGVLGLSGAGVLELVGLLVVRRDVDFDVFGPRGNALYSSGEFGHLLQVGGELGYMVGYVLLDEDLVEDATGNTLDVKEATP